MKRFSMNVMVDCDTNSFEQQAAFALDQNPEVIAFVKNDGLGFGITYMKKLNEAGKSYREYYPDFIVKLRDGKSPLHLILETKGFMDHDEELKAAAARRWCDAVNKEGSYGQWEYAVVHEIREIDALIQSACKSSHTTPA